MCIRRVFLFLAIGFPVLAANAVAQGKCDVAIEKNVAMKARDGVTLRADIYRPKADGKFPVILERTPYDKRSGVGFGLKAAANGYVYIVQDVRGPPPCPIPTAGWGCSADLTLERRKCSQPYPLPRTSPASCQS
jgi:hypothetical protein